MTKIGCPCGYLMTDNTDFLPYKAKFIADEDTQIPVEVITKSITELFTAPTRDAMREYMIDFLTRYSGESATMAELAAKWNDHFDDTEYLQRMLEELIFPLWIHFYERRVYECENCGRLLVQLDGKRQQSYFPEGGERGVLQSLHHHPPYSNE